VLARCRLTPPYSRRPFESLELVCVPQVQSRLVDYAFTSWSLAKYFVLIAAHLGFFARAGLKTGTWKQRC
jgi:hypothetical protein